MSDLLFPIFCSKELKHRKAIDDKSPIERTMYFSEEGLDTIGIIAPCDGYIYIREHPYIDGKKNWCIIFKPSVMMDNDMFGWQIPLFNEMLFYFPLDSLTESELIAHKEFNKQIAQWAIDAYRNLLPESLNLTAYEVKADGSINKEGIIEVSLLTTPTSPTEEDWDSLFLPSESNWWNAGAKRPKKETALIAEEFVKQYWNQDRSVAIPVVKGQVLFASYYPYYNKYIEVGAYYIEYLPEEWLVYNFDAHLYFQFLNDFNIMERAKKLLSRDSSPFSPHTPYERYTLIQSTPFDIKCHWQKNTLERTIHDSIFFKFKHLGTTLSLPVINDKKIRIPDMIFQIKQIEDNEEIFSLKYNKKGLMQIGTRVINFNENEEKKFIFNMLDLSAEEESNGSAKREVMIEIDVANETDVTNKFSFEFSLNLLIIYQIESIIKNIQTKTSYIENWLNTNFTIGRRTLRRKNAYPLFELLWKIFFLGKNNQGIIDIKKNQINHELWDVFETTFYGSGGYNLEIEKLYENLKKINQDRRLLKLKNNKTPTAINVLNNYILTLSHSQYGSPILDEITAKFFNVDLENLKKLETNNNSQIWSADFFREILIDSADVSDHLLPGVVALYDNLSRIFLCVPKEKLRDCAAELTKIINSRTGKFYLPFEIEITIDSQNIKNSQFSVKKIFSNISDDTLKGFLEKIKPSENGINAFLAYFDTLIKYRVWVEDGDSLSLAAFATSLGNSILESKEKLKLYSAGSRYSSLIKNRIGVVGASIDILQAFDRIDSYKGRGNDTPAYFSVFSAFGNLVTILGYLTSIEGVGVPLILFGNGIVLAGTIGEATSETSLASDTISHTIFGNKYQSLADESYRRNSIFLRYPEGIPIQTSYVYSLKEPIKAALSRRSTIDFRSSVRIEIGSSNRKVIAEFNLPTSFIGECVVGIKFYFGLDYEKYVIVLKYDKSALDHLYADDTNLVYKKFSVTGSGRSTVQISSWVGPKEESGNMYLYLSFDETNAGEGHFYRGVAKMDVLVSSIVPPYFDEEHNYDVISDEDYDYLDKKMGYVSRTSCGFS